MLGGDGRHVPAELISPVSKAILAMIPMPNRPSVAGSSSLNNYQFESSSRQADFRIGVRIDHNLSNTQRLSGRFLTLQQRPELHADDGYAALHLQHFQG